MHLILVCAVYRARSCHNIEKKAIRALRWHKQSNTTNTAHWLQPYVVERFNLFFGHLFFFCFFSCGPQGSLHETLEWMSQTPTVVLVLLLSTLHTNAKKFGSFFFFLYIGKNKQNTILRMKLYKKDASNRKISPQLITCMLEKTLRCMISKVQCWQSF